MLILLTVLEEKMQPELRTCARATLISLILTPLLACATGMKMTAKDVQTLGPDEGVILGSVRIEGGSDILGRTSWELFAAKAGWMSSLIPDYSVKASRDGEEVIFLTKMPAGSYHFYKVSQPGFSTAEANIEVPFEVQAHRTVYIGRLVIAFPSGLIAVGTGIHMHVEDVKQTSVDRAEKEHGAALSDVVTDLMTVN